MVPNRKQEKLSIMRSLTPPPPGGGSTYAYKSSLGAGRLPLTLSIPFCALGRCLKVFMSGLFPPEGES